MNQFYLIVLYYLVLTILKNKHSSFTNGHELKNYAREVRGRFWKMVQSVLGRTPNRNCPQFTDKEVGLLIAGIDANDEFRELSQHGFCFYPLPGSTKGQCHCVHSRYWKA